MQQFKIPDAFEVEQQPSFKSAWSIPVPEIEDAEEKKKLFGIELAKTTPFQAACNVFGENTNLALWVSQNWPKDPVVIAIKDKYLEAADTSQELLDKDQLARKFLVMAEEKNQSNTFYLLDGKDRLKALELYAKIKGMLDTKQDTSLNQTFIHNSMTIKVVEPKEKEPKIKIIDNEEPNQNLNNSTPIKLKLVG